MTFLKIKHIGYFLAFIIIILLLVVIYTQVKEFHLQDDPMLYILKEILKPLHPIFENIKLYKGDKSYTINKDKTFLCLKDKDGEYYPLNTLIYVLIHEISHSINKKDIGHTEEFHKIFDQLLEKATAIGVYNPSIPMIKDYCGHD